MNKKLTALLRKFALEITEFGSVEISESLQDNRSHKLQEDGTMALVCDGLYETMYRLDLRLHLLDPVNNPERPNANQT